MTTSEPLSLPRPPRLLLGVSLLCWGAFAGHALVALFAALLVEGRHWVNWRWRFGHTGYSRAWFLSLVGTGASIAYFWINEGSPIGVLAFIEWLPATFLPIILAQQYGEERGIPSTVFSAIARMRRKHALKVGLDDKASAVHVGYPYFVLVLLATGQDVDGSRERWTYFGFLILLTAVAFYYAHRHEHRRLVASLVAMSLVAGLAAGSSIGLRKAYHWISSGRYARYEGDGGSSEDRLTAIGDIREIKLSNRIEWRMFVPDGVPQPELLMTAAYNQYWKGRWRALDPNGDSKLELYDNLLTAAELKDRYEFAWRAEDFVLNDGPDPKAIRLRGAVDSNRKAIPLFESPALVAEAKEIDDMEANPLGTVMAINADGVIDYEVWPGDDATLREQVPKQRMAGPVPLNTKPTEVHLHSDDEDFFRRQAARLGLPQLSDEEKIQRLTEFFSDFRYTMDLTIRDDGQSSALESFLTDVKAGHCEYFATSTALLLRASGVPTRYVVGFAARERKGAGEFVMRGTHAHAWCRAYINGEPKTITETFTNEETGVTTGVKRIVWEGGQWVDVDLTPSTWLAADTRDEGWRQDFADWLQRVREDFQLWRSSEENKDWVNILLIVTALAVLGFIVWRLSGSRLKTSKKPVTNGLVGPDFEPTSFNLWLEELENTHGPRPPGLVPGRWLHDLPLPEKVKQLLPQALDLHERLRFSRGTNSKEQLDALSRQLREESRASVYPHGEKM